MEHWWEFKGQQGPSQARADHGGRKQALLAKGEDSWGCTAGRSLVLLCLGRVTGRRWETELVMVNDKVGLWALFWKNGGRIRVYFGELTDIENVRHKEKNQGGASSFGLR